jgi:dTDP-4-amino-4,6-dideoxygalactose transaminase
MIPYGSQDITQADIDAVIGVLRSDWLTQGPMVPRFEQAVADYCGVGYGVAVNSATSALHIACLALDVGPGDWVWTSPNTFVASANCALYCGAKVDFVDIDPRTYNMSVECLAVKLQQARAANRLPKVVIPVHFAGQPCDMPAIHKLSQKYSFKIIEDASHALGASYIFAGSDEAASRQSTTTVNARQAKQPTDRITIGSCIHSHITVFSFHPVKIITTGEGGMALTDDAELAERMFRLRTHGISSKRELMHSRPTNEIWNYQQIELGFNYRITEIQAALGLSQLERLNNFVTKRHEVARVYDHALHDLPIVTPWQDPNTYTSYHLYPIRVGSESCSKKNQRQVYDALRAEGILVNVHYIPTHRHPYYESIGFKSASFPEAELFHKEAISLPMYPRLTANEQAHVIRAVRAALAI